MIDPDTGQPIVRAVYKRDDVYSGEYLGEAADLQVGFEDGYRVSWQTTLGGSPQGIVYPNMKKWSGDHGGFDFMTTAGVLITNRQDQHGDAPHHRHRPDGADVLRHPEFRAPWTASRSFAEGLLKSSSNPRISAIADPRIPDCP